jgi:hypothetical protein
MRSTNSAKWLLLIHQLPAKPDYLRVKVRRRLHQLGAVALKNSVYVLPATPPGRAGLGELARDVLRTGGECVVCEAQIVEGLADGAIEDLLRAARESEYAAVAQAARRLAADVRGTRVRDDARRRRVAQALERVRARFDQVVARDAFGARGRETAAGLLSLVEDRLHGVEDPGAKRGAHVEPPRGATWVTRSGVMVDRIASAWLIRRFVDPAARFKFVSGRGYRPAPGELRFDMAGAEFTHRDARCTFEVLVESLRLRDSALKPIAEIVHDLDLEDGKYERPEAAGVGRMIVGLAIARQGDEARLAQGATLFDHLYESFRRHDR